MRLAPSLLTCAACVLAVAAPQAHAAEGVVFSSARTGDTELWRMGLDGGSPQRLTTSPGVDVQPSVSPDGQRIAFMSRRSGAARIWVMNADGSSPQIVSSGPGVDSVPAWSPDGTRIAFVSDRAGGGSQIYTMAANGSGVQGLTSSTGSNSAPTWSPDGQRIAFLSTRDFDSSGDPTGEVYVMAANGTQQANVTHRPGSESAPAWTPDGTGLVFGTDVGGLWRLTLSSGALVQLTDGPTDAEPSVLADGRLLFSGTGPAPDPDDDPPVPNVDVYLASATGAGVTRLTTTSARDSDPAWIPSGRPPGWDAALADPCSGGSVAGRGSTLAGSLYTQSWIPDFTTNECGTDATLTYNAGGQGPAAQGQGDVGSGAGRIALGQTAGWNTTGVRHSEIRWAGVDQPPTLTEHADMEDGGAGSADDAQLRTIPVAVGAVAVVVNLPNGCTIPAGLRYRPSADGTTRLALDRGTWAAAWAGDLPTWGDLAPGITGSGCTTRPVKRVVRRDSAGTTAVLKRWLDESDSGPGWSALVTDPANVTWPSDAGATAVLRPGTGGDAAAAQLVAQTDGAIGYGDLGTMRTAGFDMQPGGADTDLFWVPLQNATDTYTDPQAYVSGYRDSAAVRRGPNCSRAQFAGLPGGADPTRGDWSGVTAVGSVSGYPLCTLTYVLAWDDACDAYGDVQLEESRARTIADFTTYALGTAAQQVAKVTDHAGLPSSLLASAQNGAAALTWRAPGGSCG